MIEKNKITLANAIEHTNLNPTATEADIEKLCQEALHYCFFGVCVDQQWVKKAVSLMEGHPVVTVAGFPKGDADTKTKCRQITNGIVAGAAEVDIVLNIGWAKAGEWDKVLTELKELVKTANGVPLKLILETCLLTDEEKRQATLAALEAEFDFVKTSTGFSKSGANVEDIKLLKELVGNQAEIKASGGIRETAFAFDLLEAGASRLGTSSSVNLIQTAQ